jgi:hypothetical protein
MLVVNFSGCCEENVFHIKTNDYLEPDAGRFTCLTTNVYVGCAEVLSVGEFVTPIGPEYVYISNSGDYETCSECQFVCPCPTDPSPTPSVTPSVTLSVTPSITPSTTPTMTPTPSVTPVPCYNDLVTPKGVKISFDSQSPYTDCDIYTGLTSSTVTGTTYCNGMSSGDICDLTGITATLMEIYVKIDCKGCCEQTYRINLDDCCDLSSDIPPPSIDEDEFI